MGELKQKSRFEKQWNEIITLTGDKTPEKKSRVKSSDVVTMFKEVAAEREEEAKKVFKDQLKGILQAKLALDESLKKQRNELLQKEEKEYETLNKELEKALNAIERTQSQNVQLVNAASGNFANNESGDEDQNKETETE